jgi:hypothetical protein
MYWKRGPGNLAKPWQTRYNVRRKLAEMPWVTAGPPPDAIPEVPFFETTF